MEELITQAKNQDKNAFTQLVLQIEKELYLIARTRLNNDDDISDAIQETIISAFENINKLKDNKYFKTWIIKILINKCNYIYRKNSKIIFLNDKSMLDKTFNNDINDEKVNFEMLIKYLDNEEKTILTLFYYFKYTTKEISKIMNIKESTIKSKLLRAKIKIKDKYKGEQLV